MSAELRRLLAEVAERESERFARTHPDDDVLLYERAVAPRRALRRTAQASGVAAVAASVALGFVAADAVVTDRRDATPAASPSGTSLTPTGTGWTELPEDSAADAWRVSGRPLDAFFVPEGPDEAVLVGADVTGDALTTCQVLDAFARFQMLADAAEAPLPEAPLSSQRLGGFHGLGDVGVYEAEFTRRAGAAAYLALMVEAAQMCRQAVGGAAVVNVEEDVAFSAVAGGGMRVDISRDGTDPWRLWVHVQQGRMLTVIAEPGGADEVAPVITSYFTAWDR
ncbi:hypothetical protein [Demequina sp. NBRC 110051]|uniref:hypothetical protein n=1 Tax=Demequina sp. NBRC 110051 TaxID=1570340 RepID=UPI000A03D022|nr:hypothetical protein [Demequina sp. NBRC 110051]